MKKLLVWTAALGVLWLVPWGEVVAQTAGGATSPLAGQSLRGYTHMFVAYFIAWALIFGWVISIALRLGRLERNLKG